MEASDFDGCLFGETRERVKVTQEETVYQPILHESAWFLEEDPNNCSNAGDLVAKGNHYYYQKNWLQAAQHYLKARELFNEKSSLLQRLTLESLSRCYLHLQNYSASKEWAQKLLEVSQSPELKVVAHNLISIICHGLGHPAEEAEHLKFCLSRLPLNGIHWFHLGLTYLSKKGKSSPLDINGGGNRCPHHGSVPKKGANEWTDRAGLESLLSQTTISGHHEHGSANGFGSTVSDNVEENENMHVSCEAKGEAKGDSDNAEEDNKDEPGGDVQRKQTRGGLNVKGLVGDGQREDQNGVDTHEQTELKNAPSNGSIEDERREEILERVVLNQDRNEDTEASTSHCREDTSTHIGKGRDGSCHQTNTTTTTTTNEMEDNMFALICFIRARVLLKPNSSMCNTKHKKALLEVESCIQSMDVSEAFVTQVHDLCWKRQFGIETKLHKTEDTKKDRNNTDLICDQIESIFEEYWFQDILQQTISSIERENGNPLDVK